MKLIIAVARPALIDIIIVAVLILFITVKFLSYREKIGMRKTKDK
jgi:hypothetical protein